MTTAASDANPLLLAGWLPRYDLIQPEHVVPAIRQLVAALAADLDALEAAGPATWDGLVARLTVLSQPLNDAWGAVNHLTGVKNTPELRAAHEAVQGEVVAVYMRIGQSRPLYERLCALRDGPDFAKLDGGQRRVVAGILRDAELSGVGLDGVAKARFQAAAMELAELSTRFSNHVLDATKGFSLTVSHPSQVEGCPPSLRAAMAAGACAAGETAATPEAGPWRVSLDGPVFGPFMEHCRDRELRAQLYRAFITRAATGEADNLPLIERILRLRHQQARVLGKASYAELSLASKMAPGIAAVHGLLDELRRAARPKATAELADLTAFARQTSGEPALELALWDVPFWAERLRESRFAYTDEELRPYFALPRVLDGMFALAQRLFGITVRAADGEAPVWHESVRFFRVADADGRDIAAFWLDPYSRPADKRGGAWMDNVVDRTIRPDGSLRLPVAHLVCNQTPPVGDAPSLMTFREVETLFHEFGHGLQHLLTRVPHPECAGINRVEWDAVELPSQFMENWCYHRPTLDGLARHWQTGVALPDDLYRKIVAARTYRAGSTTLRQVYFSTIDLDLHHSYRPDGEESVLDVQRRIAADNTILPPLPDDRFLCSFSHIFAGGYAAGYYSYKWAEVLSADAFGAFIDAGLDDPAAVVATGRRFRDTVLSLGGSQHPLEVFKAFRGREPSVRALLEATGLG